MCLHALFRAPRRRWLALAVLCLAIEFRQLVTPSNHSAHLLDMMCNFAGAGLGLALMYRAGGAIARGYRRIEEPVQLMIAVAVAATWTGIIVMPPLLGVTLDGWDRSYRLLVGNEASEDRPWLGEIRYLVIYNCALAEQEVQASFHAPLTASAWDRSALGWNVCYDFANGSGDRVNASGTGSAPPLVVERPSDCDWLDGAGGLLLRDPTIIRTEQAPLKMTEAIASTDAFSIEMVVRPDNITQRGPARIVSLSLHPFERNFTVGQWREGLEFRVRNQVSGPNGTNDALRINYSLFRLPGPVPVVLEIYALDGRLVTRVEKGLQDSGPRQLSWDGRDATGRLLPPGLFLLSLDLQTQRAQSKRLLPLGIAY